MVDRAPFVLKNPHGDPIAGDFRFVKGARDLPAVVLLHSFMAFRNWGWFPFVAERIAEAGFPTVIFDFSRNGVRENPGKITDFDAFERNTISQELEDIQAVLVGVKDEVVGGKILNPQRIILLGHSRGGGLAIITAARSLIVKALVTWSSVCTFDRWTPHQKKQWRKLGFSPLARDSTASPLRLGLGLLEDVENNAERLDILRAARLVNVPWCLVHGTEDMTVRISEGEQLYAASNKSKSEFVRLPQVAHTYGGPDAREGSPLEHVIDLTISWLRKHF